MRTAAPAAGAAMALLAATPAALAVRAADDPPSPERLALSAPVAGHATVASQMRRAGRDAQERRQRRRERRVARVRVPPQLAAIAACESGGDPGAIGGGGLYRGKYQFDFQTWASVGGSGDPAAAPEAEQDMRAAKLYARAGAAPWPVCGG